MSGRGARFAVLGMTVTGLVAGGAAWLLGVPRVADAFWGTTTALVLLPLLLGVVRDLRGGRIGVDVIALLSMAGSLLLREELAGAVVALMLSGGQVLEEIAAGRARRELTTLVSRAPRIVHRYEGATIAAPPLAEVRVGDRLLVRAGEVVPVDGVVAGGRAVLDESALTGEAAPVLRDDRERVRSGVVNAGPPFDLVATATAAESTYAHIVRLAEEA